MGKYNIAEVHYMFSNDYISYSKTLGYGQHITSNDLMIICFNDIQFLLDHESMITAEN